MEKLNNSFIGLQLDSIAFSKAMENFIIHGIHAIYKKESICNKLIGFQYWIENKKSGKMYYFSCSGKNDIFIINEFKEA